MFVIIYYMTHWRNSFGKFSSYADIAISSLKYISFSIVTGAKIIWTQFFLQGCVRSYTIVKEEYWVFVHDGLLLTFCSVCRHDYAQIKISLGPHFLIKKKNLKD